MKKTLAITFSVFLLFGILASSFMLADDVAVGTGNSAGLGNAAVNVGAGDSSHGNTSGVQYQQNEREVNQGNDSQIRAQIQAHVETEYEDHGRKVQVQRQVQTENGTTTVQIQKTVTFANGSSYTYHLSINTQNGTREMNMEMEGEGGHYNVSIQKGLNVSDEFFGNRSQIVARLSNGQKANVSILPDQAISAALERLRIRNQTVNQSNASVQLRERIHNNVPQVVYQVQTNQDGKFLGIFKIAVKTNSEVNAENGQVVSVNQPWWAFLVSLASQGENASANSTVVTNGTVGAPMIPVPVNNS